MVVPGGHTADILLIRPGTQVFDPVSTQGCDYSVWVVKEAMRSEVSLGLDQVRRHVRQTMRQGHGFRGRDARLMADVHIQSALDHPDSPLAVCYTHEDASVRPMVIFRGEFYSRMPDGSLEPRGERDPASPTPEQWWSSVEVAAAFIKRKQARRLP